ncbi:hypothetical protein [Streptomyces sp. R41]|uniref:Uncharacterized protein n=1 Tax=Streptomyces sp. R41 TaxID=3238632 RepID=A0AB39RQ12_9ACTN
MPRTPMGALNDLADALESRFGAESEFATRPRVPAGPHPGLE